jgi:hypothetical protein
MYVPCGLLLNPDSPPSDMTKLSANLVASNRAAIAKASPNDSPPMHNETFIAVERSRTAKAARQTETKAVRPATETSIVTTASSRLQ